MATVELDEMAEEGGKVDFAQVLATIDRLERGSADPGKLVILVPGLYALFDRELRTRASIKVFVGCDADTRLNRWITTDVLVKGRNLPELLDHYLKVARPEFNEFIQPTKEFADVVLPGEENNLGISLICDGIVPMLTTKREQRNPLVPRVETDLNIYKDQEYYELS